MGRSQNLQIEVVGLERLKRKLNNAGSSVGEVLYSGSQEVAIYIHSKLPPYPAPPPGSNYVRTGTLGRTSTARAKKISESESHAILGSPISYAPWVVSEERTSGNVGPQAWFHKGRWTTWQKVIRDSLDKVKEIYRNKIRSILNRT